jgi:hypothetical protein
MNLLLSNVCGGLGKRRREQVREMCTEDAYLRLTYTGIGIITVVLGIFL